ncbi:MAG TPA: BatA domain-containing protein, partial [bacterium]
MTFLNSALLWGLLGAALPLLIHLFSRRKFPRIDFSTLRFLRRLQSQQMRRLRLRQWLLLLLRTLAIFLIAFAFLRPALRSRTGIAALSGSRISLVIILDASASMQAASQSGSCFDVARSAADSLLAMLNSGDRALVIIARKQPEVLLRSFSEDGTALRRWLKSEQPSDGPA